MILPSVILQVIEFCKKALVAEDPEQFAHLTVRQLEGAVARGFRSSALMNEIKKRLRNPNLSHEDREILIGLRAFLEAVTREEKR